MSRYCSLSTYTGYIKSVTQLKDKSRNVKCLRDLRCFLNDTSSTNVGYIKNVLRNMSQMESKSYEYVKASGSAQPSGSKDSIATKSRFLRSKTVRKEAQKLYTSLQKRLLNDKFLWTTAVVATTTTTTEPIPDLKPETNIGPIPEPPAAPPPEGAEDILNQLNALGEHTFASLGLGGRSPVGFAQTCFEYLHVTLGLEWWAAIVLGTVVIRICLFPLVVIAQKNAARMNNHLPQLQMLQMKMQEARESGNRVEVARYSQEMMIFMKEKKLNPLKNMIVPLAQMPIFISFFMALREMANVPVESLKTGGILWFTDLTVPDQFFLLPLITSATLYATIAVGTDGSKLSSQQGQIVKYVLRALPIIVFPFTINFPGAILCYWVSSNFISLLQVGFLRIPTVREYFKIDPLHKIDPQTLPMKPKGFRQGLQDAWTNIKLTKELEERHRLDEITFKRAGRGAITKTYKYDPTKQADPGTQAPISAKKR